MNQAFRTLVDLVREARIRSAAKATKAAESKAAKVSPPLQGWCFPWNAQKAHFIANGASLCQSWRYPLTATLQAAAFEQSKTCVTCLRRVTERAANEQAEASDACVQPVQPTPARRQLRLLCLLVPGRNGQARALPVHTLRPMPPRICPTRAHAQDGLRGWHLESPALGMGSDSGLCLRETHATAPAAEVLERCAGHGQGHALRPALGSVRVGGLSQ